MARTLKRPRTYSSTFSKAAKRAKIRRGVKRTNFRKNVRALKRYIPRPVVNTGAGFPQKMVMTHKYCDKVQLTSTLGVITNYLFSCNGLYDPNITGTGHQPAYFDQMTPIYNNYTVIMSRIKVTFWADDTNSSGMGVVLTLNDDTSVTNTGITTLQEQTGAVMKIAGNVNGDSVKTLTKYWGARKTFGSGVMSQINLRGSVNGNPAEQNYFVISAQSLDGASTQSIWATVEVTYTAVWTELKDIANS